VLTSLDIVVLSVQVSGCRGGGRERERGRNGGDREGGLLSDTANDRNSRFQFQ